MHKQVHTHTFSLIAHRDVTDLDLVIMAPAIYLMGSQVQYMGRIMGPIGTEGRYIPVMIAISVLNAFAAMFVMNILV